MEVPLKRRMGTGEVTEERAMRGRSPALEGAAEEIKNFNQFVAKV